MIKITATDAKGTRTAHFANDDPAVADLLKAIVGEQKLNGDITVKLTAGTPMFRLLAPIADRWLAIPAGIRIGGYLLALAAIVAIYSAW